MAIKSPVTIAFDTHHITASTTLLAKTATKARWNAVHEAARSPKARGTAWIRHGLQGHYHLTLADWKRETVRIRTAIHGSSNDKLVHGEIGITDRAMSLGRRNDILTYGGERPGGGSKPGRTVRARIQASGRTTLSARTFVILKGGRRHTFTRKPGGQLIARRAPSIRQMIRSQRGGPAVEDNVAQEFNKRLTHHLRAEVQKAHRKAAAQAARQRKTITS